MKTQAIAKMQAVEEIIDRLKKQPEYMHTLQIPTSSNLVDLSKALGVETSIATVLAYGKEILEEELAALAK